WFMVNRLKNIDAILPGKVYEYIGARKTILACVPDGAAKLAVEEYGASVICEPENIVQIKDAILNLYEMYKNNQLPVPDEQKLEKYRRDYLTEMLSKQFLKKLRPV